MKLKTNTKHVLLVSALAACAMGISSSAQADGTLQAYYEARAEATRGDETLQLNMPNHYLELRLFSTPWDNVESFMEISASTNRFRNISPGLDPAFSDSLQTNLDAAYVHDPKVFFNEGHVKLRGSRAELLIFSSQNRFWFSQPLLQTIDGGTLQDDFWGPRSQAVRVDFWDVGGFQGLAYYGSKSTNDEDFVVSRITRQMLRGNVLMGTTFGRKDFGTQTSNYDLTTAFDVEFALGELFSPLKRFGRTTLVVEAARNQSGWVKENTGGRNGTQVELRDIRIWDVTGKWNGWYREPNLYTGLSSQQGNDDRRGMYAEAYYRLPRKQVDLRYAYWGERAIDGISIKNERLEKFEHSLEAYAELKGGFSAWVKYREFHTNDDLNEDTFRNLIFELQAQNKLISVRPQVRIRDISTPFQVSGFGMEINLNATSKWKFFARFLNAVENTESRNTMFLQTRYSGFQDAEFFIEYGDGGRSDRLTENDHFVSEGPSAVDQDGERRIQAFFKFWF